MNLPLTVTNATRAYVTDAGLYLIRDVRDVDGRFVSCEYGTLPDADAVTVEWTQCAEGVAFADIEPLVAGQ